MKQLSKDEMKKVMGGTVGDGDGICHATCPDGSLTCSSDHMDCKTEKNALRIIIKIYCDGTWLTC